MLQLILAAALGLSAAPVPRALPPIIVDSPPVRFDVPDANERLELFVPKNSQSVAEAKQIEARKLYVLGCMELNRKRYTKALDTLKKALEHDPTSVAVLRTLVPLCFQLQRGNEGIEYCKRALKVDPENYELLQFYGLRAAEEGDLATAIDALERASKVEKLRVENGPAFLEIRDELAQLYERQGNPAGVARAMRDVIEILEDPDKYNIDEFVRRQLNHGKVRYYETYGRALKNTKQFDEAARVLTKGRELDGRNRTLDFALAEVHFEKGDYELAKRELDGFLQLQTQDARAANALILLEKLLGKMNRSADFLPEMARLVDADPNNPARRRFYGQKLTDAKQFAKAEEQLLKVASHPGTLALLTRLYREMDQPAKLLESLAKGLMPGFSDQERTQTVLQQLQSIAQDKATVRKLAQAGRATFKDPGLKYAAQWVVANVADEAKELDLGREFFELCIKDQPENPLPRVRLANLYWENEKYDAVAKVCAQAIKDRFDNSQFYSLQALALEFQGKTDEAVRVVESLLEKGNNRELAIMGRLLLSQIYQHAKKWDKAIDALKIIIDGNPNTPQGFEARYRMSNVYTLKGDNAKAEQELLGLIEADNQGKAQIPAKVQAGANNDLGYLWADEGKNLDRAEKMVRRALELEPTNAAYLDSMGWVLFKLKRYKEAIDHLKRATKGETGEDGVIWDHLGDAHRQLGDKVEAAKAWEKSIELYKKDKREAPADKIKPIQQKLDLLKQKVDAPPKRVAEPAP